MLYCAHLYRGNISHPGRMREYGICTAHKHSIPAEAKLDPVELRPLSLSRRTKPLCTETCFPEYDGMKEDQRRKNGSMKIPEEEYRFLCVAEEDLGEAAEINYHIPDSGFGGAAFAPDTGFPLNVDHPRADDRKAKEIATSVKRYYDRKLFDAKCYHAVRRAVMEKA
jgi:hypothetical protein